MTRLVRLPGYTPYVDAHKLQKQLVDRRIRDATPDTILLLEHEPVITVGRKRGAVGNVLAAGDWPVVEVERGGDVTWHGPGQLVAYPIIKLEGKHADLHWFLHRLEDAVIDVLGGLGISGQRDGRNTGVWVPEGEELPKKVCSVGIACRKWVTWHGLALNVDVDLGAFRRIHPCGFDADVMTRIVDHVHPPTTVPSLVEPLATALTNALELERGPLETLSMEEKCG